jgi:gamma-D-glutamyl-L-lysine dipeptidyl-peptidase
MRAMIDSVLTSLRQQYRDARTEVFDVQASVSDNEQILLTGRVLDELTCQTAIDAFKQALPATPLIDKDLVVLRRPDPEYLWVATNLTSLHNDKSFLAEMASQMLYGTRLEVLESDDRWVFVRQDDGYLGWTYRPYLTGQAPLTPTHLALHPVSRLRAAPEKGSALLTRVLGGTAVAVIGSQGEWAEISANACGWLPSRRLRALSELPVFAAEKRSVLLNDGRNLLGVPYLWGGASANGIDCSGLAQLLHRWLGITIPRDADMQYLAGTQVEPPFQPGDLIFFGEPGESRNITHVGISVGEWQILHSSRARNGVYIDDVEAVDHLLHSYYGACTYIKD